MQRKAPRNGVQVPVGVACLQPAAEQVMRDLKAIC